MIVGATSTAQEAKHHDGYDENCIPNAMRWLSNGRLATYRPRGNEVGVLGDSYARHGGGANMTSELTIHMPATADEWYLQLCLDTTRKQLIATMQREERLRVALIAIDMQAMQVMQDDVPPYGSILRCGWVHEVCTKALSNEVSDDKA